MVRPSVLPSPTGRGWRLAPQQCRPCLEQQRVTASAASARAAEPGAPAAAGAGKSAIVVGAGVGGLVVAGRLAKEGVRVTLLEQNDRVGGRCQSMERDGYRWDTGPSLLLFPDTYKDAFTKLGTTLEEHVPIKRVEPAAYRVFFGPSSGSSGSSSTSSSSSSSSGGGGSSSSSSSSSGSSSSGGGGAAAGQRSGSFTYLDLLYDVQMMSSQLEAIEPGAGTEFVSWLAAARRALVVGTENFIARDAESFGDLLDPKRLLPLLTQVDVFELLGQHHGRLSRRFKDPRICALLSFQDLYVGLSPYNAPGVFSLLAATELTDGVYYPLGGFGKVRDSLLRIAQSHGAQLRTGARVKRLLFDQSSASASSSGSGSSSSSSSSSSSMGGNNSGGGGRVVGVELDGGERLYADAVVANPDVAASFGLAAAGGAGAGAAGEHARERQRRLEAAEYSAGVIAFNWAVEDYRPLDALRHHNVFLSGDQRASWRRARAPDELQRHPNFYLHCPSRTDAAAAPPGCHSVMVLLPVANAQERGGDDDYSSLIAAGRAAVLRTLRDAGLADGGLEAAIAHETVICPREWRRRYALTHGAAFGLAHGLDQLSLLRPGFEDGRLPGLYFVGASARPGNGVPLVMMGADMCAGRVLRGLGVPARA